MTSDASLGQKSVTIHTDGACLGQPRPRRLRAAVHGAIRARRQGTLRRRSGSTTNNRMEIAGRHHGSGNTEGALPGDRLQRLAICGRRTSRQGWARSLEGQRLTKRNKKEHAINPDLWEQLDLNLTDKRNVGNIQVGTRTRGERRRTSGADRLAVEAMQNGHGQRLRLPTGPLPTSSLEHRERAGVQGGVDVAELTHIDPHGNAHMVDVGGKPDSVAHGGSGFRRGRDAAGDPVAHRGGPCGEGRRLHGRAHRGHQRR